MVNKSLQDWIQLENSNQATITISKNWSKSFSCTVAQHSPSHAFQDANNWLLSFPNNKNHTAKKKKSLVSVGVPQMLNGVWLTKNKVSSWGVARNLNLCRHNPKREFIVEKNSSLVFKNPTHLDFNVYYFFKIPIRNNVKLSYNL